MEAKAFHWFPTRLCESSPFVFFCIAGVKSLFGGDAFSATPLFREITTRVTSGPVRRFAWSPNRSRFSSMRTLAQSPCPLMWSITITARSFQFFVAVVKNEVSHSELQTLSSERKITRQRSFNYRLAVFFCLFFCPQPKESHQICVSSMHRKIPSIPFQFIEILSNFYGNLTIAGACRQVFTPF